MPEGGASDYLLKPADPEALEVALTRALAARALRREVRYLRGAVAAEREPLGESPAWRQALEMVDAAAATDSVVLLRGESGTGKELLARRLHQKSARAGGPYVRVNCAAVPTEMWESEFFGHRKGSFTGASADRDGRFQLAHGGTLFLDEIGAMPVRDPGQAAARDPGRRVPPRGRRAAHARGRADRGRHQRRPGGGDQGGAVPRRPLLPPERPADPGAAAARAPRRHPAPGRASSRPRSPRQLGRPAPELDADTVARLRAYAWPGNVRELRSVIERALVLHPERGLAALDLAPGAGGSPGGRRRGQRRPGPTT